jgi:glycosyltransferase involved in cell wall biosynthesis
MTLASTAAIGVVIPAYKPDVERLSSYIEGIQAEVAPEQILIELDGADPDTVARLRRTPALVHVVRNRRGKGAAIACGFDQLHTDLLVFVDADGSTTPASIAAILAPLVSGAADLSVGARRHPDAIIDIPQPLMRRFLGWGFSWFARRLLNVTLADYQCGAKALTRETWYTVRSAMTESGFAWDLELVALVAASHGRISEVPIRWNDHAGSTVAPMVTALELLQGLLSARSSVRRYHERDGVPSKYRKPAPDEGQAGQRPSALLKRK